MRNISVNPILLYELVLLWIAPIPYVRMNAEPWAPTYFDMKSMLIWHGAKFVRILWVLC